MIRKLAENRGASFQKFLFFSLFGMYLWGPSHNELQLIRIIRKSSDQS